MDFDTIIDRRHTGCNKWDKYGDRDIIPMWVADMDFRSPPAVLQALHERVGHGVFGYSSKPSPELVDTVITRLQREYGWQVDPDWLVWLPGLVCGLNVTCRAVGEDGDDVITAIPVYHHLFVAPTNVRRNPVTVPMNHDNGRWTLDFDALEAALTPNTRLFLLCNPHNPVGRMYDREELLALAEFCDKHDLILCSDEIHCQLILDQTRQHIPIASIDPAFAERTITLMAPSKTYNLPGLGCSFAVIPNEKLRQQFVAAKTGIVPNIAVLSFTAALAAYRDSDDWLQALLEYLRDNYAVLGQAIETMPGLSLTPLEATYLGWIDARETGLDDPAGFFEQAGVGLHNGVVFKGPGFLRLNFGCPRGLLEQALERMRRALAAR